MQNKESYSADDQCTSNMYNCCKKMSNVKVSGIYDPPASNSSLHVHALNLYMEM